jgi:hypothetical protein
MAIYIQRAGFHYAAGQCGGIAARGARIAAGVASGGMFSPNMPEAGTDLVAACRQMLERSELRRGPQCHRRTRLPSSIFGRAPTRPAYPRFQVFLP